MAPTDHWVELRDEQQIENVARRWRRAAEQRYKSEFFNMVEFIKDLVQQGPSHPDYLRIKFFEKSHQGSPARVGFKPLTLWSHVDVWAAARDQNDEYSRYVLAHECGHIALHDHTAKAYSGVDGRRIPQENQLRSAEWQADRFADHLLMPTEIVERINNARDLAIRCGVELHRAESRIESVREYWMLNGQLNIDQCDGCLGYNTTRIQSRVRCNSCGNVYRLEM